MQETVEMQGKMAYGGDGLSAGGTKFYEGMLRSAKARNFEGEGLVNLWKEIWKEEKTTMLKVSGQPRELRCGKRKTN